MKEGVTGTVTDEQLRAVREISDLNKRLRESQTREAQKDALVEKLREALTNIYESTQKHRSEPHAYGGHCCGGQSEPARIAESALSLSGHSALAEVKAQAGAEELRAAAKKWFELKFDIEVSEFLNNRAAALEAEGKGDGDETHSH